MENNEQSENSSLKGPLPKKGFLDNLAKKADELKDKSIELGKMAAREAGELGEKIEHQKIMNELMSADMSDPAI
jgi:hypothetical protein